MFKKGESGNPSGTKREKRFLSALERAISQEDGKLLRKAAESLLAQAAAGESWAICQLADRLDGKPGQSVDVSFTATVQELTVDELRAIASGSRERIIEADRSPDLIGEVH